MRWSGYGPAGRCRRRRERSSRDHGCARGAKRSAVVAERCGTDLQRFGHVLWKAAKRFRLRGLQQLIGGIRDKAPADDNVRIRDGDEVGDGHPDITRRISNHGNRYAVAIPRSIEDVMDLDCRKVTTGHVEHPRLVTRFDSPYEPADDPSGPDLRLERAEATIVLAFDGVEREP